MWSLTISLLGELICFCPVCHAFVFVYLLSSILYTAFKLHKMIAFFMVPEGRAYSPRLVLLSVQFCPEYNSKINERIYFISFIQWWRTLGQEPLFILPNFLISNINIYLPLVHFACPRHKSKTVNGGHLIFGTLIDSRSRKCSVQEL